MDLEYHARETSLSRAWNLFLHKQSDTPHSQNGRPDGKKPQVKPFFLRICWWFASFLIHLRPKKST
jgi:hypothetical protein